MLATALTTALPPIIKAFDISVTTGQWLTSGYSLASPWEYDAADSFSHNPFSTENFICPLLAVYLRIALCCRA